jgi:hypothetical protein
MISADRSAIIELGGESERGTSIHEGIATEGYKGVLYYATLLVIARYEIY